MRYATLPILSALLLTTALPAMAASGMNKHDASIATYDYSLPIIVNTSTLSTGSLRDELDNGTRLQADKAPAAISTPPAVIKPTTSITTPTKVVAPSTTVTTVTTVTTPAAPVAATPKATDVLPDTLAKTSAPTIAPAAPAPTMPAPVPPVAPEAAKPAIEGMMDGQAVPTAPIAPTSERVPLATTKGM